MADRKLVVEIIGDASSLERSFGRASSATNKFDRNFSRATRGVLSGSGVFRSLGRSLAFASGGFLAFGGAAAFLRKSVDAAKEAQVANAQLATQLSNSGKSFDVYRGQIDKTIFRLSALAGVQDDELKAGLTTILRTVPDVSKALRDLGTATDLARARHISLAQASVIIAKTEAGNTTLLRRQGFQIAKNATAEQALAKVRQVVAGQAAAGTTQQERFGAVLHQTEEIIGQGILPTLNKYLISGTRWLEQMNESGKLQKDVANAAEGFAAAVGTVASVVKTVDKVTGGFKNTLELILGLKIASVIAGWAGPMLKFAQAEKAVNEAAVVSRIRQYTDGIATAGTAAEASSAKVNSLRGALLKLGAIGLVTVGIEVLLNKKTIDSKVSSFLDSNGLGFLGGNKNNTIDLPKGTTSGDVQKVIDRLEKAGGNGLEISVLKKAQKAIDEKANKAAAKLSAVQGAGPHGAALLVQKIVEANAKAPKTAAGLSADQRNSFFDNTISRILLRGGLGDINAQIAALQKADSLIAARLKVTKDVTRRLNLEDELLQNQAQIKTLQGQQTADALQAQADARQKALDALQAKLDARKARQFRELGLTAAGDDPVAGVGALKGRLAQLTSNVNASSLNTPKLQSELKRFRKVLSEGIVPRDVRSKIKGMMDQIAEQLKNSTQKNATKFRHTNANALLAGLGLDAETTRILRQRLAQVGAGGTVPGSHSLAFAGAGAGSQTIILKADGRELAKVVTPHQRRANQRRSESRRGPFAGRH